ncbi:unnamed protein product [Diatraea saccharalis]|uniref:Inosine/uridine-preferring nucleoside hydrolase domain-containing protein n=1 Tax=Diatraea saccharalis TaxID=40085 RepID=A0A9N9N1U8_9NEOP|nr:unnamed protein product [Diatraea saccharalis]
MLENLPEGQPLEMPIHPKRVRVLPSPVAKCSRYVECRASSGTSTPMTKRPVPEVTAITTTHGNVQEPQTYENTQKILDVANRMDIPIYRGSKYPIIKDYPEDHYFGFDGLGDNNGTYRSIKAQPAHAVFILIELSKKYKDAQNMKPEYNALHDVEAYYIVAQNAYPDIVTMLPSSIIDSMGIKTVWRKNVLGAINTDLMRAQNKFEEVSLTKGDKWELLDPTKDGKLKLVIDNDAGGDDAMAIFLALLYEKYYDGGSKSSIISTDVANFYYGIDGLGDTGENVTGLVPAEKQNAVLRDQESLPEFNAKMDPEAYHIVAQNANPDKVTIIPFSQTKIYLNFTKTWRRVVLGGINSDVMRQMNKYEAVSLRRPGGQWTALDPAAVSAAIKPDLVKEYRYSQNDIILCGDYKGINTNKFVEKEEANVRVIYSFNDEDYRQYLIDLMSRGA